MSDKSLIEKIVNYIEEHLDEELSLKKISDELNYSKFYMSRVFQENTGNTIHKYIQTRRLTIAAQKLVKTNKPIIEIAYEANYNSQQAFTLAFSQLYLCSPQIYRKNGVFYPKQTRLNIQNSIYNLSMISCWFERKVAA